MLADGLDVELQSKSRRSDQTPMAIARTSLDIKNHNLWERVHVSQRSKTRQALRLAGKSVFDCLVTICSSVIARIAFLLNGGYTRHFKFG